MFTQIRINFPALKSEVGLEVSVGAVAKVGKEAGLRIWASMIEHPLSDAGG